MKTVEQNEIRRVAEEVYPADIRPERLGRPCYDANDDKREGFIKCLTLMAERKIEIDLEDGTESKPQPIQVTQQEAKDWAKKYVDSKYPEYNDRHTPYDAALAMYDYLQSSQPQPGKEAALREAAQEVIDSKMSSYTARNGRSMSIEDGNGEKCWIVPFDQMAALENALKT